MVGHFGHAERTKKLSTTRCDRANIAVFDSEIVKNLASEANKKFSKKQLDQGQIYVFYPLLVRTRIFYQG